VYTAHASPQALPKNTASTFSLLNSITLIRIKTLAHNLFHKICEEGSCQLLGGIFPTGPGYEWGLYQPAAQGAGGAGPCGGPGYAYILCSPRFSLSIQALETFAPALHTLFSTVCVQSRALMWTRLDAQKMGYEIFSL
jgi:hypothetical protein